MATDFFQRQADARRSTFWLVAMFSMAVLAIVAAVVVIAWVVMDVQFSASKRPGQDEAALYLVPFFAGVVTLAIIAGGSCYKVVALRAGGGTQVAESLGGKRIYPNTTDPVERRLSNVVEEMALASGMAVPPIFLLEEDGINAFAAGYSPSDAVLGVTRGCAERLSRDELQGVIAHEFSHVLNGDMRMSIRLIGILHGILLIGLTGQLIMRTFFYAGHGRSRSRGSKDGGGGHVLLVILAIGVAAIVLGFIGTFFGNLIKAAVSRQREYLADASAVQFTRNPSGIAGALKRIGGLTAGSRLQAANAAEASHMYFAQGVWEGISGLWATHPPLPKRIRAIEPSWDGKFLETPATDMQFSSDVAAGFAGSAVAGQGSAQADVPMPMVDDAVRHIGEPTTTHQQYARQLLQSLPAVLLDSARDPYGARALVYALLLDDDREARARQVDALWKHARPEVLQLVKKLQPSIDQLDVRARMPLIELSVPALRAMSPAQYEDFRQCFIKMIKADETIDLFEWMLSQILIRDVHPQFGRIHPPRVRYYGLQRLHKECSVLLSVISAAGNSEATAREAFAAGANILSGLQLKQQWPRGADLDDLRKALATLQQTSVVQRGRLVEACAAAICADRHVKWQEAELLRGIAALLDCPIPPLVIETSQND